MNNNEDNQVNVIYFCIRLSLNLELTHYSCLDILQNTISKLIWRGTHTVCDWMNLCGSIIIATFEKVI